MGCSIDHSWYILSQIESNTVNLSSSDELGWVRLSLVLPGKRSPGNRVEDISGKGYIFLVFLPSIATSDDAVTLDTYFGLGGLHDPILPQGELPENVFLEFARASAISGKIVRLCT